MGIQVQTSGVGRNDQFEFTPEDERKFKELAKVAYCVWEGLEPHSSTHDAFQNPKVYDIITHSIAPSIYGSEDIKRAIACLLFGGSRKR
jgi:DNA replication licensing factor MCM5